jgi:hypothetical protein
MNSKKLLAFLVLATIIAGALFFVLNQKYGGVRFERDSQIAEVKKTNVDFANNPDKFPSNVPIEQDAKLTQNYNAQTPDGKFQATKTFQTEQSLSANLSLYTNFLNQDGWKVIATTDDQTYKMVTGTKGKQTLQISIDENKINKVKTVSITLTETK